MSRIDLLKKPLSTEALKAKREQVLRRWRRYTLRAGPLSVGMVALAGGLIGWLGFEVPMTQDSALKLALALLAIVAAQICLILRGFHIIDQYRALQESGQRNSARTDIWEQTPVTRDYLCALDYLKRNPTLGELKAIKKHLRIWGADTR